jgi:light-regulated signal transduction histidine kinase (bacteriophytochrome)
MIPEELDNSIQENSSDLILTHLLDAIIILDITGYILYANKSAEKLFGKPLQHLVGENFGFPIVPFEIHEIRIVKNGRICKVEMLATTIQWKGEEAFLMSLRDVSDKRKLEEELLVAYDELKQKTKILNEVNSMLVQSNEALQQFAHVASHDLKEPLRKIRTYISRVEYECSSAIPQKCTVYLKKIDDASRRMALLIDGILNYSTINASNEPAVPVDLKKVIKDVETDLEVVIQQKRAIISHDGLPTVEGAPVLLHQLFYNLINNALKFSKKDRDPVITLGCQIEQKDGEIVAKIVVQDNGIGFSAEHAENIFDTFSRLNSKDKYEGTGLGLALCKRIVQRHNGSIKAHSKVDQGAKFEITLPLKQKDKII